LITKLPGQCIQNQFATPRTSAATVRRYHLLADRTGRSTIGYWHDTIVCLSVCPSICDAMHCGTQGR